MYFRPFPVLTLIAIPALAALISLGVWQLQRAEWKAGLIQQFEQASNAPPLSFESAVCGDGAVQGRIVSARDVDQHVQLYPSIRMFGQSATGQPGWRLFSSVTPPACAGDGVLLAELGFEPLLQDYLPSEALGRTESYLLSAWPRRGMFALDNDPADNDWHWFDAPAMAKALGVPKINDRFYLAIMPETLPAHLSRTPPATHIGYAVTWFGMAVAFVVIYAVFHARAGRLRFRRQDPPPATK
jgi:surfeit locus 1 family protein